MENDLRKILKDKTLLYWSKKRGPLLLSTLAKEIQQEIGLPTYNSLLGDSSSLKSFIQETQSVNTGYKLIEHPEHKAKIGLIPFKEDYFFSAKKNNLSEADIAGFVKVLKSLTEEELKQLSVPASLIVRLFDKN